MGKALIHLPTATFTLVTTSMENHTVKESTFGPRVRYTQGTSSKVRSMDAENGEAPEMFNRATLTKESIRTTESTEKVFSHGQVETFTKATTATTRGKAMVRCSGPTAACMKVNGSAASSMDLAG